MRLTKVGVESALATSKDTYLWDSLLTGFGVKVTPKGARVYLVQYRAKATRQTRRVTLGRHGDPWTTEKARDAAQALLARVRLGEDPYGQEVARREEQRGVRQAKAEALVQAAADAFPNRVAEFIDRYAKPKNRRWTETLRILTSADLEPWSQRTVGSITRRDVVRLIDQITDRSHGAARLVFVHLRRFFNWCVERLYLDASPCAGLKAPALAKPRDRVLTDAEVSLVWRNCRTLTQPFGPLIKLLLLTGQRREEVSAMRWTELDLPGKQWIIPSDRTKNGHAHAVDLSEPVLAILTALRDRQTRSSRPTTAKPRATTLTAADDFVFTTTGATSVSGHAKIKTKLDEAISANVIRDGLPAVPAWRIHDLRRTAATGMARLGFDPHVVEAVLNHRSGVRGGLVAVYQHYDHRPARFAALTKWADHVMAVSQDTFVDERTPRAPALLARRRQIKVQTHRQA